MIHVTTGCLSLSRGHDKPETNERQTSQKNNKYRDSNVTMASAMPSALLTQSASPFPFLIPNPDTTKRFQIVRHMMII